MRLVITEKDIRGILESARESPIEICGFLLGRKNGDIVLVEEVVETKNRLNSPLEFEIDSLDTVEVLDEAEDRGIDIVGIFHSHLKCPPIPSRKDLNGMNLWRNVWLIVTPSGEFRAWILENGEPKEVKVEME